ncbi:MAG: recombination protein RecA [Verrucomicrobiales bacterium]|jgi:recombination protein RecA
MSALLEAPPTPAVSTESAATPKPTGSANAKKSTTSSAAAVVKKTSKSAEDAAAEKFAQARGKNLDVAISQIQKDFGEGSIMRMGEDSTEDIEKIPTGNLLIDRALGVGGFPRGRIIEMFGPESSGKTTLALTVVAQAQKAGGLAAFVDVEHALDPSYAEKLGVNLNELLVSQPSSGEEALRIVETLVRSNSLDVIVLDSVAALVTKAELDGEIGDTTVGAQARLMSAAMRKLTSLIAKARTCAIFTNQIREKIGVMFGNPETTPGGRALKFYSSVRVDIRRIGAIKQTDGTVTGNRTRVKIVKNKVAPPYTEAEFDIMYAEGISSTGSLLDLALEYEIVQKRGSWFSYKGTQMAQGRDGAKEALKEDESLYTEIETAVKEKMAEKPKGKK